MEHDQNFVYPLTKQHATVLSASRQIGAEVTIWNAGQNYIHIDLARFFTCQMPILGSGYVFD